MNQTIQVMNLPGSREDTIDDWILWIFGLQEKYVL